MVAFKDDSNEIQQKIGPIRNSDELKAAILSGAVASITPADHWLVAWHGEDGIVALEFAPVVWCRERWPTSTEGLGGSTLTLEIHQPNVVCVSVHPSTGDRN